MSGHSFGRRTGGGVGRRTGPMQALMAMSGTRPLFTADKCIEDPANPGYVLRIISYTDPTHWLEQTDNAKQVAMPKPHGDFGGRLCFTFTLNTQAYVSNKAAIYPHDGTGFTSWEITGQSTFSGFAPVGLNTCSIGSAAVGPGFALFHSAGVGWRVVVSNGATYRINTSGAGGDVTGQSRLVVTFGTSATPDMSLYRNGASLATADATSLSGAASAVAPTLGAIGGSNGFVNRKRAFGYMPLLTAAQVTELDRLLQSIAA